jgi:hypothetical protein
VHHFIEQTISHDFDPKQGFFAPPSKTGLGAVEWVPKMVNVIIPSTRTWCLKKNL